MSLTTTLNKNRKRGDTQPWKYTTTSFGDITGLVITLTVDTLEAPPAGDATQEFTIAALVTDGPAGDFEFRPTAANMDLDPDVDHFFDIQIVDGNAFITTIVDGQLFIDQDITKV